jgi:hypothetical protein
MAKPLKCHFSVHCNLLLPEPDNVNHDFGIQCDIGLLPPSQVHVSFSESSNEYEEPMDQSFSMEKDKSFDDDDDRSVE